jgi:dipeptidyl aminopeptidase/acylaminoacyl peptidase
MFSPWPPRVRTFATPLAASVLLACGAPSLPAPGPALPPVASVEAPVAPPEEPTARPNPALLSRKIFFEPVVRSKVKISPDGTKIGWLASVANVVNVWVGPADDVKKAQPVTHSVSDDVHDWWWTYTSDRILFSKDHDGDEKWHVSTVDLTKGDSKDLTAIDGVRADVVDLSPKRPREVLLAINDRDKKAPDVYVVDMPTGARKMAQQNDGSANAWIADADFRVRFAEHTNTDASVDILNLAPPAPPKGPWKSWQHVPMEDTLALEPVDFDKAGNVLFVKDARSRDMSGLFAIDTKTGVSTLVAEDPQSDVGQVLMHPTNKTVEAVSFDRDKPTWKIIDAAVEADFYYLSTFGDGTLLVSNRSLDEQHWIVAFAHTDGPTHYYRYDRDPDIPGNPGKATLLFNDRDDLESVRLSMMVPVTIKSRDGLDLVSYLTIPYDKDPRSEGRPKEPLPMVILVHDGPWSRAALTLDATHSGSRAAATWRSR